MMLARKVVMLCSWEDLSIGPGESNAIILLVCDKSSVSACSLLRDISQFRPQWLYWGWYHLCSQLDNRFNFLFLGTVYKFTVVYNWKRPLNRFVCVCRYLCHWWIMQRSRSQCLTDLVASLTTFHQYLLNGSHQICHWDHLSKFWMALLKTLDSALHTTVSFPDTEISEWTKHA